MSEIDKFFADLKGNDDSTVPFVFEEIGTTPAPAGTPAASQPANNEGAQGTPAKVDEGDENTPFHKHPRWQKMQKELRELRELKTKAETTPAPAPAASTTEVPVEWLQMYGDTDDTRKAWAHQSSINEKLVQQAEERAYNRMKTEFENRQSQEKQFEQMIESNFEEIEDSFGVDLSSNTPAARKARTEFLELVQKLSPKDASGAITAYADFPSTWEIYAARQEKPNANTNKTLSARGGASSNNVAPAAEERPTWEQFRASLGGA